MGRFYSIGHRGISPMKMIVGALAIVHLFRDLICHGIETPSGPDPTHRPEYCTMFHHMVKSGGTSIRERLTIASNKHSQPPPGLCVLGAGSGKACLDSLHHSSVIVGYVELLRKPMEELGRQCQYFTMMRHPIDRLISAFFYCPKSGDVQRRPSKWCGEEKDDQLLEERLVEFAQEDWKCKAMLQLSFSHYCPPGAFCEQTITPNVPTKVVDAQDWEILAHAEKILLSYDAVGIREEWELSMRLFDAKIRSPVDEWNLGWLRNPGPQTGQRAALLEWARSSTELRQILAGDLLLYDLALSIFKKQTEEALGVDWRVPRKINEEAP